MNLLFICLDKEMFTNSTTPEIESQEVEGQQFSDDKNMLSAGDDMTHEQPSGSHSPRETINHEQQVTSQQINQFNSSISRDSLSPETLVYNRE